MKQRSVELAEHLERAQTGHWRDIDALQRFDYETCALWLEANGYTEAAAAWRATHYPGDAMPTELEHRGARYVRADSDP